MKIGKRVAPSVISVFTILVLSACANPAFSTPVNREENEYLVQELIPPLTVPEGAQQLGGGGGGGPNGMGVGAFFTTQLDIADVYQHYLQQLQDAGWKLITEQASDNEMTGFWEVTDDEGAAWSGKLNVVFSPPDFPDTYKVDVLILLPQ
jgi:hypothetical protein